MDTNNLINWMAGGWKDDLGKKECLKCDYRGMIKTDKYSAKSCDCGRYNDLMNDWAKNSDLDIIEYFNEKRNERIRERI